MDVHTGWEPQDSLQLSFLVAEPAQPWFMVDITTVNGVYIYHNHQP